MITREECLEHLKSEAQRYRNAPTELARYPEARSKKFRDHWQKMAEIYEMAAEAVERNIR